jgi:hypothetical protein
MEWLKEIQDHTEEGIIIMLIGNYEKINYKGNKYDLIEENNDLRAVSLEDI